MADIEPQDPAPTERPLPFTLPQPDAPAEAAAPFACIAATDGRVIRIDVSGRLVELTIEGRRPVVLDHYQTAAMQAALDDILSGCTRRP
jgi:hypothetical protein